MSRLSTEGWLVGIALLWVIACAAPPVPTLKAHEGQATLVATRMEQLPVVPTPTGTLAQHLIPSDPEMLEEIRATVVGVYRVDNVSYFRLRSATFEPWLVEGAVLAEVECSPNARCQVAESVASERPAAEPRTRLVAAPRSGAPRPKASSAPPVHEPELLVRVTDPSATPRLEGVTLRSYRAHRGGLARKIQIAGSVSASKDGNLERDFAVSWAEHIRRYAEDEPFAAFAAARLRHSALGLQRSVGAVGGRPSQKTDLVELMDFYTGRDEIRRTLQTDRGLVTSARALPKTLAIGSIQGVQHEPRDYRALLSGGEPGRAFVPHPLAGSVPNDALVAEFSSIRDLVSLPQQLDQRLGRILAAIEQHPGDDRLQERYREQLILEHTSLAEKLGPVAIGALAVVLGDPYLREGSDLSLVFEVKERQLLEAALGSFVVNARRAHPELKTQNLDLAGSSVVVHATPNGRLRRYQAWVGSELLLSNSQHAMLRLLELKRDKTHSLLQSPDYRWARSMAPFTGEAERAHIFFGDAFVDKIVGPRSKILEARRLRALSELRSVEYAALLFGWMQGTAAKNTDELLASGWLKKSDLVHFDGSPITFEPRQGASSNFGTSAQLLPIVDLEIANVDKEEADAYARFRSTYERGMRGALDPTTLRFFRTPSEDQWRTELRILPLAPAGEIGTEFRELVRTVGRGAIEVGKNPEGLRVALGISRESPLRDLANGAIHGVLNQRDLTLGFLGDWVQIGIADDPWLWNFAVAEGELPELFGSTPGERAEFGIERNLHRLPLWAAVQIKSPMLLSAALAILRAQSHERLGDWVKWHDDDRYRDLSVTRVEVRPNGEASSPFAVHFAVAKDVLILSIERRMLELRVDEVLAGLRPKATDAGSGASQLAFTFEHGSTHHLTDVLGALLDTSAIVAHRRACTGLSLLAAGFGEEAANGQQRSSLGLRILGYVPESPAGPGLVVKNGRCQHPIYGTSFEPKLPDGRAATAPLHAKVRNLMSLRFGLAVIPRADEQELVGRAEMAWK